MMRYPIFGFCVLLVCCFAAASSESPKSSLTSESIGQEVRTLGAKATVEKLNSGPRPRRWDLVLDRIESGAVEWLGVAKDLSPGTDAGTSTGLRVTLARALPKNPGGVLALIDGKVITVEYLCTAPFIEPEAAFLRRYLRDTKSALETLKDSTVDAYRRDCLQEIQRTMTLRPNG